MSSVEINTHVMEAVQQELVNRLSDVGYTVENYAKDECPVDTHTLQRSISNEVEGNKVTIGTNVEYAAAVHEGHGNYPGVPFLRDAVYLHLEELRNILGGK